MTASTMPSTMVKPCHVPSALPLDRAEALVHECREIRNRVNGKSVNGASPDGAGRVGGGEAELRRLAQPRLGLRRRAQRAGEADLAEDDRVAGQRDVLRAPRPAPRRPRDRPPAR